MVRCHDVCTGVYPVIEQLMGGFFKTGMVIIIKMESTSKLSNFNFKWTKTLYQNDLNNIALFLHFSRPIDVISYL